jgi:hypothetical protein
MNKEDTIKQLNKLIITWSENGINTKLNQIDINAIIFILNKLDLANKKLEEIKEVLNLYSNATIENPNNGYVLYQKVLSIIVKESDK